MTVPADRKTSHVNSQRFREAMSRLAAPMTVVTARDETGRRWGCTASSVTSASLDPPLLLVALARTASCHAALTSVPEFAVNVLSDRHVEVARRFATHGVDRFAGTEFVNWPGSGIPYLPDAIAVFRCNVADILAVGDHDLLVGAMADNRIAPTGKPLVWYDRDFHLPYRTREPTPNYACLDKLSGARSPDEPPISSTADGSQAGSRTGRTAD